MENKRVKEIVAKHIRDIRDYCHTEEDSVDLYEFVFDYDQIIWFEELQEIFEELEDRPNIEPIACMGVGSTLRDEDKEAQPILRIELWKS